jgi:4-diphosphocytidyl-2-C-methyl-D-erythritol kinase
VTVASDPTPDPDVTEIAPAKLNWTLEVVGVRPDGLHLLDSEMVSLDLADRVSILPADTSAVEAIGEFAAAVNPEENTVISALRSVGRAARVRVTKLIPVGGGLGGGSADAAAVLRWAGVTDTTTAVALGSDVPFCLAGGRARVRGVGEIVEPLATLRRDVTLLVAPFPVSTAACYLAYDELVRSGARPGGRNHLAAPACAVEPRLDVARQWLGALLGQPIELSGSGSTMFVEGFVNGIEDNTSLETPAGPFRCRRVRTMTGSL